MPTDKLSVIFRPSSSLCSKFLTICWLEGAVGASDIFFPENGLILTLAFIVYALDTMEDLLDDARTR